MYISKDGKIQDQEHLVASFIISLFLLPVNHLKLERNLAHLEFDGTPLWIFLSKNVRLALKIRKSIDNKIKLAIIIPVAVRSLERSRNLSPRSYSRSSKVFCKRHKWRTNRWEIFIQFVFTEEISPRARRRDEPYPKPLAKTEKKVSITFFWLICSSGCESGSGQQILRGLNHHFSLNLFDDDTELFGKM